MSPPAKPGDLLREIYEYYPGTAILKKVVDTDGRAYAELKDYSVAGQIDYGNGTATRYAYAPVSQRLHSLVTTDPTRQEANDLQRKSYAYSPARDITSVTDNLRGVTYQYRYDALHRLLEEESSKGEKLSYTYDAMGNILTKTAGTRIFKFAYNDPLHRNALSDIMVDGVSYSYKYNAAGDMTAGPDFTESVQVGKRNIAYGSDGMPLVISNTRTGRTVEFVYGAGSERVVKRSGSSTTLYVGSHYEDKDGVIEKYVFAGGMRVAKIKGTNIEYYHQDHLGSTGIVTDSRGMKVESTEYMPFGPVREQSGTKSTDYKYTGKELDPETGLYNYGARFYDLMIGRFVMADTIVPSAKNSQAMNPYSYCMNNPLVYNDPSGHYRVRAGAGSSAHSSSILSSVAGIATDIGVTIGLTAAGIPAPVAAAAGGASSTALGGLFAGENWKKIITEVAINIGAFAIGAGAGAGAARLGLTWKGMLLADATLGVGFVLTSALSHLENAMPFLSFAAGFNAGYVAMMYKMSIERTARQTAQHAQDITALNTATVTKSETIKAQNTEIALLKENIGSLEESVTLNKEELAALRSGHAKDLSDIVALNKQIAVMNNDFEAMRSAGDVAFKKKGELIQAYKKIVASKNVWNSLSSQQVNDIANAIKIYNIK